jgi:hypothetical protein
MRTPGARMARACESCVSSRRIPHAAAPVGAHLRPFGRVAQVCSVRSLLELSQVDVRRVRASRVLLPPSQTGWVLVSGRRARAGGGSSCSTALSRTAPQRAHRTVRARTATHKCLCMSIKLTGCLECTRVAHSGLWWAVARRQRLLSRPSRGLMCPTRMHARLSVGFVNMSRSM